MKEDASNKEKYILTSVDNTLSLLNLFFDYEELSVNDAAKLLGLSRSTVFRFMVTLENRGFLSKTDHATYRLGLNMFSLGMLAYNRMELAALIHPYLQDIARQTGETSHLGIVDDGIHIMFIDRALGTSQLKMETALGYRQLARISVRPGHTRIYKKSQLPKADPCVSRRCRRAPPPSRPGKKRGLRLRQRRKRTRPDLFCRPYRRRNRTSCRLHQHFRPDDAHENA